MDVYDLIDEWDLNSDNLSFKKFTRSQISVIASRLTSIYSEKVEVSLGRKHLSLHESISAIEGIKPLSTLSSALLFSKQIWLPDPLYSALSLHTKSLWNRLPESGPKNINGNPSAYMPWDNYWSTKSSERISYLDATIPKLVSQLMEVKPLVRSGFVFLHPWEVIVKDNINYIKDTVVALQEKTEVLDIVRHKYIQEEYSIGARLGPIGISVSSNPPNGLKPGDSMWFGDPSDVIYGGMLNTLLTSSLSADFINSLKGDRVVHDFIRSGGEYNPVIENKTRILLPNLNHAIWKDVIAIKHDSELISILTNLIEDSKNIESNDAYVAMKEELKRIEEGFKKDLSIMKLVGSPIAELTVGTMAGVTGGILSGGNPLAALIAAGLGSTSSFLLKLALDHQSDDRRAKKARRDIICNISNSI